MELELQAGGGGGGGSSRVVSLSANAPEAYLGRGDPSQDRTVSRRHVSLRLRLGGGGEEDEAAVAFEVVGRNPVVVRRSSYGGGSGSRVFRRGEEGELRAGDAMSLSLKAPAFWAVRKEGNGDGEVEAAVLDAVAWRERRMRERKERERLAMKEEVAEATEEAEEGAAASEVEGMEIDLASVDPVQEFGFLSMGHEFDNYPKGRIRPPKDWNWFLEEIKGSDDDNEVGHRRSRSKGRGGKKKKDAEGEDEDWTDESEDEKETLAKGPSVKRTKYVTRSKDLKKPRKGISKVTSGNNDEDDESEEEEDEEDETLGGFIVNEDDDEPMEEPSEEEEEEDFDDEEDDD